MDKTKGGYLAGAVSIIINAVLFGIKFWAGIVTGSLALIADAWHTLSDSLSSVIVVIAVKLGSKKPDKQHPFGHGRWDLIAALFIAFILGIIAYDFLKEAVNRFGAKEPVNYGTLAIIVTIASIAIKEALAQYAFYVARKTESESLKADAWHHRSDALSSVVVLVGIVFARQFWWIDSVLTTIIALMLFYAAFKIIKGTVTKLLGEEPDNGLLESISAQIKSIYKEDLHIHHYHIHDYVSHKELTLHIRLNKNMTVGKSHEIASKIEKIIESNFGMNATIHIEPLLE